MKFEEILFSLLTEQIIPQDYNVENPEPEDPTTEPGVRGDNNDNDDETGNEDLPQATPAPKKEKQIKPIDRVKLRWKEENPGLNDEIINDSIDFFNRRKNGLREYKSPAPAGWTNQPEVAAMKIRFPEFPAEDLQKLRNIENYTWDNMEYFMDRFNVTLNEPEMDFTIEGDTPQIREQNAYKKWESPINRILNENNLTVYRVEGKNDSIALGILQHILVNKYGGNYWCITLAPGEGNNLYSSYRNRRSYYFVLDKNKDPQDNYYLSTIEPVDMRNTNYQYEGPFAVTPRGNGTNSGIKWDRILQIHPQLEGKEGLFRFFGQTEKEGAELQLDKISFRPSTADNPNPYDFVRLKLPFQRRYIESGRPINSIRAFGVLPEEEKKSYIARTTLENWKARFKCDDAAPFAILDMLQKQYPGLYRFLDQTVLKTQLHLPQGVLGIRKSIISINFKPIYSDIQNDYTVMMQRNGDYYGVIDINNNEWVKDVEYFKVAAPYIKMNVDANGMSKREMVIVNRFLASDDSNKPGDYFYFVINQRNLTDKTSENYMKGDYLSKEDGDHAIQSGQYRKLG